MLYHMTAAQIQDSIRASRIKIAIIGLGQVGLPLALHFAREGASVIGADIDEQKINSIKQGTCPLHMNSLTAVFSQVRSSNNLQVTSMVTEAVRGSNVHIICVSTPLGRDKLPDLSAVVAASEAVGKGLKKGDLVILESSVYPGVTAKVVKPTLENQSGLRVGEDFGLAYCFERIDPGNLEHRLDNTSKVIGDVDEQSTPAAMAVYSLIIKAPIIKVRNCETAEMVKLVENVYRDVNIAFANELALLCQRLNIDVLEVLSAASTKWNFIPHVPGPGVGGMCIPVNPYYLLECAREAGLDLKLVRQAREINESMPCHMVELVKQALARIGKPIEESKICILGLAYKADVDDTRGASAKEIANKLEWLGAKVICHDPLVTPVSQGIEFETCFEEAVKGSDCIVITTDHSSFQSLNLQTIAKLAHRPLAVVDGRHVLVPREVEALGITYIGLGRDQNSSFNIWNSGLKAKRQKGKD